VNGQPDTLLAVENLRIEYRLAGSGLARSSGKTLRAVDDVSFTLQAGETLGVVGESGCGKSTLLRGILGLTPVTAGSVRLHGRELTTLDDRDMRPLRRLMQIVFQDPLASLDPRMTVAEIIAEPLQVFEPGLTRHQRRQRVEQMMRRVGLLPQQINRYPHEFSGGQAQRIGIARALISGPQLLLCDEPVSALDVSIQAQIINLLTELQRDMELALLFIAHDLSIVRHVSHRILVMYLGRAVEIAPRDALFRRPRHPYTRALIDAIPIPDPALQRGRQRPILAGEQPSPVSPPVGCHFRTRCPRADERCQQQPGLRQVEDGHWLACHIPEAK
jgi:oligopeptide transport system ATP-binding protein